MQWTEKLQKSIARMMGKLDLLSLPVSGALMLMLLYLSLPLISLLGVDVGMAKEHAGMLTSRSVLYSLVGIACFTWGAFGFRHSTGRLAAASISYGGAWNNQVRVLFICAALLAAGFGSKLIHVIAGDYHLNKYLGHTSELFLVKFFISLNTFHFIALAVACCYYYWLKGRDEPGACLWRKIAFGLFAFEVACGLLMRGSRFALVVPVAILLLTRHYLYQRNNRLALIVGIIVVVVLFPVKNILRNPAELINNYLGKGVMVLPCKGMDTLDIIYYGMDEFLGRANDQLDRDCAVGAAPLRDRRFPVGEVAAFASDSTVGRLAQAHVFALIVRDTNEYLYGRSFLHILVHFGASHDFVERISGVRPGDDFAVKAGFVGVDQGGNPLAGVGYTIMGDLYLNFGIVGTLAGMVLVGYLVRRVYCLVSEDATCSSVLVYTMVWIFVLHGFEQSLSAAMAKLFQIAAITMISSALMAVPAKKLPVCGAIH